jgi:hypothetical protein
MAVCDSLSFFASYRYTHSHIHIHKKSGTILSCALFMGPNRAELVKYLINKGAVVDVTSYNGTSTLTAACANEDADLHVVKMIVENSHSHDIVNQRIRAKTPEWRVIYMMSKLVVRSRISQSTLMKSFAERQGRTALHYAARRGDLALVELLLSLGADPSMRDDMGRRVKDVCKSLPELQGVLEKRERKIMLRGTKKKKQVVVTLGKRISTATPIQHEMWLISLETLLMLYVLHFSLTSKSLSLSLSLFLSNTQHVFTL